MPSRTVTLNGWGRIAPSRAELAEPGTAASAAVVLKDADPARGVIARGLGRSYNDAAQCAGGTVMSTARLNQIIDLDTRTVRTADIDETMAVLTEHDRTFGYTVAWSDSLATGASLGRSVVTSGDFAEVADLPPAGRADPFAFRTGTRLGAPGGFPPGLINRYTVAVANEVWYRKAPRQRRGELQTIGTFFHPLDGIRNWNRVYGPGGFRQYQYVVPAGQEAAVRRSFELIGRARAPSFVTVLKRFGEASPGLLSFPMAGWTLALDFPARTPGLSRLLARLDQLVLAAGGRVYLAKDSRVPADVLAQMYPRLPEFRELRAGLDPAGILASDLSRRLAL